jgi:hypothetical protein
MKREQLSIEELCARAQRCIEESRNHRLVSDWHMRHLQERIRRWNNEKPIFWGDDQRPLRCNILPVIDAHSALICFELSAVS